jgi:hypothetical protein
VRTCELSDEDRLVRKLDAGKLPVQFDERVWKRSLVDATEPPRHTSTLLSNRILDDVFDLSPIRAEDELQPLIDPGPERLALFCSRYKLKMVESDGHGRTLFEKQSTAVPDDLQV